MHSPTRTDIHRGIFLIINGITVASIYGLIAVAVSITWSALGLLNLSYGFIFSFAGYGAWLAERYLYGEPIFVMFMGIAAGIVGSVMAVSYTHLTLPTTPYV